jgi:hypothetical protein
LIREHPAVFLPADASKKRNFDGSMHFTDGNVLSMINEKAEDQPKIQDSDLYKTGMDRKANKNKSCGRKRTRIGGEERCIQQKEPSHPQNKLPKGRKPDTIEATSIRPDADPQVGPLERPAQAQEEDHAIQLDHARRVLHRTPG